MSLRRLTLGLLFTGTLLQGALQNAAAEQIALVFKKASGYQYLQARQNPSLFRMPSVLTQFDVTEVPEHVVAGTLVSDSLPNMKVLFVESGSQNNLGGVIQYWLRRPDMVEVVRNRSFEVPRLAARTPAALVNAHTIRGETWGIRKVNSSAAWTAGFDGDGVKVMVMDSGVDRDHGDLRGRVIKGKDFTAGTAVGNFDNDTVGHGTHVAGTILADGSGTGLKGVAPSADLYVARVCETAGCDLYSMVRALEWAVTEQVDVVNISIGADIPDQLMARAVSEADRAGVVVVAATGNSGGNNVAFPAAFPTVLAVGATNNRDGWADFSQYGVELDVVAPGVDVFSAVPNGLGLDAEMKVKVSGRWQVLKGNPIPYAKVLTSKVTAPALNLRSGTTADFQATSVRGKWVMMSLSQSRAMEQLNLARTNGAVGVFFSTPLPDLQKLPMFREATEIPIPVIFLDGASSTKISTQAASVDGAEVSVEMLSTDFAYASGTSMASPHAAGVAALVRQANPNASPAEVRRIVKASARKLGSATNATKFGSGLVDAAKAVQLASGATPLL